MTEHEAAVIEAFEALQTALRTFSHALIEETPRCWLPGHSVAPASHKQLAELYNDIWYTDGNDGRTTRTQCGLVGCSTHLLDLAAHTNQVKTRFQHAVALFRSTEGRYPDDTLTTRAKALAAQLNRKGLARLHLKQCYRHIPVLSFTPLKVGFNWYRSGRSIKRISVEDAINMLLKMDKGQPHIQIQLKVLASLPTNEPLAQLQPQAPVVRANLQWREGEHLHRKALNCPLPILFPLSEDKAFPAHNEIAPTPPLQRERRERSDLRIDPSPLLPGLRIHRYKA